jgi:hypothetical protein
LHEDDETEPAMTAVTWFDLGRHMAAIRQAVAIGVLRQAFAPSWIQNRVAQTTANPPPPPASPEGPRDGSPAP